MIYPFILELAEGDYDKGVANSKRYKQRLNKVLNKEEENGSKTTITAPAEGDYDKGVPSSIRYKERLNKVLNKEEDETESKIKTPHPEIPRNSQKPLLDNIPDLNKIEKVTFEENPYYC